MSKNQKEVEVEEPANVDLQELLKYSRRLDENIANKEAFVARQAAMAEHGLVEPLEGKTNKAQQAAQALKNEVAELTKTVAERDGHIDLLSKQLESLHAAITTKDGQLDELMEQLAEKQQPAPVIPPAIPAAPAAGDKPNPFA